MLKRRASDQRGPARSSSCWRPRRSSSACGSGGVGKTTTAAAAAAMAATRQGGKVLVLTVDPAAPAGQRPRPRRLRQRRDAGARSRRSPTRASRRAASCGRPCSTPSSRGTTSCSGTRPTRHRADRSSRTRCTRTSRAASCRATTTSPWSGCTRSTASGKYDLIVVDTPPTRNALDFLDAPERMADFFSSRFLRLLTAPYRVAAGEHGVASRSTKSPTASSARSSSRTSPSSSSCSRRCTPGSWSGPEPSPRCCTTSAPRSWSCQHAGGGAAARGRVLHRGAAGQASFHLGAVVLNKVLPSYLLDEEAAELAERMCR